MSVRADVIPGDVEILQSGELVDGGRERLEDIVRDAEHAQVAELADFSRQHRELQRVSGRAGDYGDRKSGGQ